MLTVPEMDQTEFVFDFDRNNPNWTPEAQVNLLFLRAASNFANDKLKASGGPLFLNDVLDMLHVRRIRAGQVVGWEPGSTVRVAFENAEDKIVLRIRVDGIVLHFL